MVEGIVNLLQEQIHIRFGNMQLQLAFLVLAQIHQLIHKQQQALGITEYQAQLILHAGREFRHRHQIL